MNLDKTLQEVLETMGKSEGQLKVPTDAHGNADQQWLVQMIVNLKSETIFLKAQGFVLYTIANKLFETIEEENKTILEQAVQDNIQDLKDAYEKVRKDKATPKLVKPSGGIITP